MQQGNSAAALPFYERALKIYEKAFGPQHPDVAHTLTDLAVLHLEQVRVWREWLERNTVDEEFEEHLLNIF
jgi:centrosomal protein CEP104